MSYVHSDNSYKRLTKFHEHLSIEAHLQRGEIFKIFMDKKDIKYGQAWHERITKTIDHSTFFIPIITPSFFMSTSCREELGQFLKRERELKRNDLIFPVYYIDCRQLNNADYKKNDNLALEIAKHQYFDWRQLRLEPMSKTKCKKKLAEFASQLVAVAEKKRPSKKETPILKPAVLLSDDFEVFKDWFDYLNGSVTQSDEKYFKGRFSLKKEGSGDPSGGFKKLARQAGLGLVFSGRIHRPSGYSLKLGDRLSIENADFSGYGFTIAHGSNLAWIERRDEGVARRIGPQVSFNPPRDSWYYFEFYMNVGGFFDLHISVEGSKKDSLIIRKVSDNNYNLFDRVSVHGGSPYYIDDLEVKIL